WETGKGGAAKRAPRVRWGGTGLGASTERRAVGGAAGNAPSAPGWPAATAAAARKNSRNSPPVRTGKPFVEWATMSVWTWSARWKRTAIPRGPDRAGSLSEIVGMPVESE